MTDEDRRRFAAVGGYRQGRVVRDGEPRTAAGRALLAEHGFKFNSRAHFAKHVRAIEAEATASQGSVAAVVRAAERAEQVLAREHTHNWRPDLVQCEFEQDALSILRGALSAFRAE